MSFFCNLEWVEYGRDNWAPVSVEAFEYGTGTYQIADSWFADKPAEICFRANGVELMDHRGGISAGVWNKTKEVLNYPWWVRTSMGGGMGTFSINKSVARTWGTGNPVWNGTSCVIDDSDTGFLHGVADGTANRLYIDSVDGISQAHLRVNSTGFGMPPPLMRVPDGTIILEALAEITSSNLVKSYIHQTEPLLDCEGNVVTPGENPDGIPETSTDTPTFSILGFTSETDFDIVGSVTPAAAGTQVVDVTTLLRSMLATRSNPIYTYGYGLIYSPVGLGDGVGVGLEQFIKKTDQRTISACANDSFGCVMEGDPLLQYYTLDYWTTTWDDIQFGMVAIKLQYPDEDTARTIIIPRAPSMKPLPL